MSPEVIAELERVILDIIGRLRRPATWEAVRRELEALEGSIMAPGEYQEREALERLALLDERRFVGIQTPPSAAEQTVVPAPDDLRGLSVRILSQWAALTPVAPSGIDDGGSVTLAPTLPVAASQETSPQTGTGIYRLDILRSRSAEEFIALLTDVVFVYNHLYALDLVVDQAQREIGKAPIRPIPDPENVVPPVDRLRVRRIQVSSPGWLDIIGQLNPLETLRKYLADRHERNKDVLYRNEAERVKLALENARLKTEVLTNRAELLQSLGVPQDEQPRPAVTFRGTCGAAGRASRPGPSGGSQTFARNRGCAGHWSDYQDGGKRGFIVTFGEFLEQTQARKARVYEAGLAYFNQQQWDQARDSWMEALEIMETLAPYSVEHGALLTNMGILARRQGRSDIAEGLLQSALAILTEPLGHLSSCLNAASDLYREDGRRDDAISAAAAALYLAERFFPNTIEHANSLNNLALPYLRTGETQAARQLLEKSREVQERLIEERTSHGITQPNGAWQNLCAALSNLGGVCSSEGDLTGARAAYHRADALLREHAPADHTPASVLNNIGWVEARLAEWAQAQALFTEALNLAISTGGKPLNRFACQMNLGWVCREQRLFDRAREYYDSAMDTLVAAFPETYPRTPEYITWLNHIGILLRLLGDREGSLQYRERALADTLKAGAPLFRVALCRVNLGFAHLAQDDTKRAELEFAEAAGVLDALPLFVPEQVAVYNGLGRVARACGEFSLARERFARAAAAGEGVRGRAGEREIQERLFEWYQEPYYQYIGSTADDPNLTGAEAASSAFDFAERGRAVGLHEMLAEARRSTRHRLDSPERAPIAEEERRMRHAIAALRRELADALSEANGDTLSTELRARLRDAEDQLTDLQGQARRPSSTAVIADGAVPVQLADLQSRLGAQTVFLEYHASGPETFLIAARSDAAELFRVVSDTDDLCALLATAFGRYDAEAEEDLLPDADTLARERNARSDLSAALLRPALGFMAGATRVIVSPDGPLHRLPFEALPWPTTSDGSADSDAGAVPFSYTPSGTVLYRLLERPALTASPARRGSAFVAFSSGEHPEFDEEATRVATLFADGGRIFPKGAADVPKVYQHVQDANAILFTGHGVLDDAEPLYSYITLSPSVADIPGNRLETFEMLNLPLTRAEVVVLSACNTARGRIRGGEGVVGMARSLLVAGARNVVVSLWSIPTRATARLIHSFFRYWIAGYSPQAALHAAKADLRRLYRDPLYWAGFILIGAGI